MRMKYLMIFISALILQGCSLFGIRTVELLDYQILEQDDNFELRQYDDYWVARTEIDGGEKLAMTGPVIQQKKGERWVIEFVLPAKYNTGQPPEPLNTEVSIVKVSGYKAAALRYSGSLKEEKISTKIDKLLAAVESKGLQPVGEPFSAGYDPPWTLPFLKRNEVLIKIE